MELSIFSYMEKYDYENVFLCQDKSVGLKAVIAIHDTTLGPATGGCRMWTYASEEDAIEDALRLARGMTYKYAAAGVNLGGGKVVILGDPKTQKSEALFRSLGRFIHRLGGLYITGEDVGTTLRDMEYMRMETPYVVTLPESWGGAGPISPATALGVTQGMRAALEEVYGTDSLEGRTVAVQGLGSVGWEVVSLLTQAGARVLAGDIDSEKVEKAAAAFGVETVADPNRMHALDVDVYCPCALGGIINDQTIGELRCKVIAGSANNQLYEEKHGDLLHERNIAYAPDYIINAGGTIFDTDRLLPGGMNSERAMENVRRIKETMKSIFQISKHEGIPTYQAADRFAQRRIESVGRAKGLSKSANVRMG
ncbi:leucine dehydrogenase [Alicyclobacillus tolerans]|nr:leucine dehydrogenase [Alicyclobacillus tolerans]